MYDELVKQCRDCIDCLCGECKYEHLQKPGNFVPCMNALLGEAADAIEAMSEMVTQAISENANTIVSYEESKPRWIPVTERLPNDIDEEVLVCTEDYGVSGLGLVTVATYGDGGWLDCWERKTYITAVTHWMPLPQPPEEE